MFFFCAPSFSSSCVIRSLALLKFPTNNIGDSWWWYSTNFFSLSHSLTCLTCSFFVSIIIKYRFCICVCMCVCVSTCCSLHAHVEPNFISYVYCIFLVFSHFFSSFSWIAPFLQKAVAFGRCFMRRHHRNT